MMIRKTMMIIAATAARIMFFVESHGIGSSPNPSPGSCTGAGVGADIFLYVR